MNSRTIHMITDKDKQRILDLAARWMELAAQPVMAEPKKLWQAVHDLKMVRPTTLVETSSVEGCVNRRGEDQYVKAVLKNQLEENVPCSTMLQSV